MPKYLKIENCGECPYVDSFGKPFGMGTCNETNKFYNGVKLDTIPEWCPLEDAGTDDDIKIWTDIKRYPNLVAFIKQAWMILEEREVKG
jgi:hypothetical protein